MPLQILHIPTTPFFRSKLRIYEGTLPILNRELIFLALELEKGLISQQHYDDSVAAIEQDKVHVESEIERLTEIRYETSKANVA